MTEKEELLRSIVALLSHDFDVVFRAARTAHEAATHEENLPDNKYDTLSLEASYVAQGQANRAQEIKGALDTYRSLELQDFDEDTPVRLTALVTLEDEEGTERTVFLGPAAGGLKVSVGGREVVVITVGSPLGSAVLGKICGDSVSVPAGGVQKEYEIVGIA
jgi:transcription elongation GreA/GreB family factor